jgi:hypothetical protein
MTVARKMPTKLHKHTAYTQLTVEETATGEATANQEASTKTLIGKLSKRAIRVRIR